MVAVSLAAFSTLWAHFVSLVDIIKTKGFVEVLHLIAAFIITAVFLTISLALYALVLLHQSLVWLCSTFLLVNVDFFSIKPHPASPSFQVKRRASLTASLVSSRRASFSISPTSSEEPVKKQSNEAGDTPPNEILAPAVLSPTQLEVRSLSPAFDQSIQAVKNEVVELMEKPSSKSATSQSQAFSALLSKRRTSTMPMFAETFANRIPMDAGRSMSTISYPDVGDNFSTSDDSESGDLRHAPISEGDEREGSTTVHFGGRTDIDLEEDDEEYDDDSTGNLRPDEEVEEIPFTSSPGHVSMPLATGPEMIDVLDPESRKASMNVVAEEEEKLTFPDPIAMPMPKTSASVERPSITPPPSQVLLPAASNTVESPRDLFSPTPQPTSNFPFAFLREQAHRRLYSDSSDSGARWGPGSDVEEVPAKKEGERVVQSPPYPSPPFTPPSVQPPPTYGSMAPALQVPPVDSKIDPFVLEKSQLSALVDEAKAALEAEKKVEVVQAPTQAPDHDANEEEVSPVQTKMRFPEPISQPSPEPVIAQVASVISPESSAVKMPTPKTIASPPRALSPVRSIGQGGLHNGSHVKLDDIERYTPPSWQLEKESKRTSVASEAEERLNEVDDSMNAGDAMPERPHSPASGADDESTAPKTKLGAKKKNKKNKNKKRVSFEDQDAKDEVSSVGDSLTLSPVPASASITSVLPPSLMQPIPVPKSFEIEEEEDSEAPALIPTPAISTEAVRGSPLPSRMSMFSNDSRRDSILSDSSRRNSILSDSRRNSVFSDIMSPRSTADEMSDSSSAFPLAPGEYSAKQVDQYARWFARAHRDKSLPTIQAIRNEMKDCSDTELVSRLKLGSRSDPTKLSKSLVGEEASKGATPPIRKNTFRRRK